MSWQAMDAVDRLPYDLTKPLAYRVLVKLANVASSDGTRAWRSKWEMADELGVSERSIQRALAELEALNCIRKGDQKFVSHLRGGYRPTVYDIVMSRAEGGIQTLADGLDEAPEAGETRGETEISTGTAGETRGETTAVAHRELRELTTNHEEISLVPDVRAHDAREILYERLRSRCTAPFEEHAFRDHDSPVYCDHACGVRSDGLVLDTKTADELAPPRSVVHA